MISSESAGPYMSLCEFRKMYKDCYKEIFECKICIYKDNT